MFYTWNIFENSPWKFPSFFGLDIQKRHVLQTSKRRCRIHKWVSVFFFVKRTRVVFVWPIFTRNHHIVCSPRHGKEGGTGFSATSGLIWCNLLFGSRSYGIRGDLISIYVTRIFVLSLKRLCFDSCCSCY